MSLEGVIVSVIQFGVPEYQNLPIVPVARAPASDRPSMHFRES